MKKLLTIFLSLLCIVVLFCGCNEKATTSEIVTITTQTKTESTDTNDTQTAEKAAAEKAATEKAAAEKAAAEKAAAEKAAAEKAAAEKFAAEKAKRVKEIDDEIASKKAQIEANDNNIKNIQNSRSSYQSSLSNALSELSYARNNKVRVYISGIGWVYQVNQNAVSSAESKVNRYKSLVNQCDLEISSLKDSNYLLKQEIEILESEKAKILTL